VHQNGVSDRTSNAPRPANNRAKLTNNPRRLPVSGRSALGRRIHDLADGYAAALGGWDTLTDMMAGNIRKAAELTALSEQARANALRDGNVDPLSLVRLDGAANRAVRMLQLDVPREPASTLQDFLDGYTEPPGNSTGAFSSRPATSGARLANDAPPAACGSRRGVQRRRWGVRPMTKPPITAKRLREVLSYNPDSGELRWLESPTNRVRVGDVAGRVTVGGHRRIGIDGFELSASRLAVLWMTSRYPTHQVTHLNGDCSDLRWSNLKKPPRQARRRRDESPPNHAAAAE
jgi:hypothetical protein